MAGPDYSFETTWHARGITQVAGVDEVGRGPLAGPVVAAAVILDPVRLPAGLNDSKQVSAKNRALLAAALPKIAMVSIAEASVKEIDALNIRQATFLAMRRAVEGLAIAPEALLIDGRDIPPGLPCHAEAIVKGDGRSRSRQPPSWRKKPVMH